MNQKLYYICKYKLRLALLGCLDDEVSATWSDFQRRHVVNAAPHNACQWNQLLRQRLPNDYLKKQINTYVVSSPSLVQGDFPNGVPQVNKL